MISAQEAREITVSLCKEARRNLEDIEKEIKCHAEKGEHFFWHDGYVHRQAIKALKDLGYQLQECDSQIQGYSLQIKW
jgi:Holliday junction resolvasome RuvABC DNA-binding subunit